MFTCWLARHAVAQTASGINSERESSRSTLTSRVTSGKSFLIAFSVRHGRDLSVPRWRTALRKRGKPQALIG